MREEFIIPTEAESVEVELGKEGLELIIASTERFNEAVGELLVPYQDEIDDPASPLGQLSDLFSEAYAEITYVLQSALDQADAIDYTVTDEQAADIQRLYDVLHETYEALVEVVERREIPEEATTSTAETPAYTTHGSLDDAKRAKERTGTGLDKIFPQRELGKDAVLDAKLLEDSRYKPLIQKHFSSPTALEAALWRFIHAVEEPSKLDKVLGIKHGSIFKEILKGRTVAEIEQLFSQPGQRIREVLKEMEREDHVLYDYRIFVDWMEELHYLIWLLKPAKDVTVNELLVQLELLRREETV